MLRYISRLGLSDALEQPWGVHGVAEQMHGFLPAREFLLLQDDDVALAALPGNQQRRAVLSRRIHVAREVVAQLGLADVGHGGHSGPDRFMYAFPVKFKHYVLLSARRFTEHNRQVHF